MLLIMREIARYLSVIYLGNTDGNRRFPRRIWRHLTAKLSCVVVGPELSGAPHSYGHGAHAPKLQKIGLWSQVRTGIASVVRWNARFPVSESPAGLKGWIPSGLLETVLFAKGGTLLTAGKFTFVAIGSSREVKKRLGRMPEPSSNFATPGI